MKCQTVPSPTVKRLSLYLRRLERFAAEGIPTVTSRNLGDSLDVGAAQVRRDLACFGQFGRPGVGYQVTPLVTKLKHILGTDKTWPVIVIGAADLGRALVRYKGFQKKGFNVLAAFDITKDKVGRQIGDVRIYHIREVPKIVRKHSVKLAVLAVPAKAAQEVTDMLCKAGVKGILNLATTTVITAANVVVGSVDIAASLEQVSFRVKNRS